MDTAQLQELAEGIAINALNGGPLVGIVFRHDDSGQKAKSDMISVKAGAVTPELDGPRCMRVEIEITLKSGTATRNSSIHGEAIRRITYPAILRAAALDAGLKTTDDFYVMDEEIGGDRSETKNLRKRTITVPFLIKVN